MTNPTLVRAAKALTVDWLRKFGDSEEEAATHAETHWPTFVPTARVVLTAVRGVDQDMQRAGMQNEDRNNVCATYTAMIDAILDDGEGE